jgi:hypothetical protein
MLKAYKAHIDGSGTGNPNLLVLAGYIAPAAVWADFSKEWQTRLDQAGLSRFKMTEMRHKQEIAGWFYRAIEESDVTAAISCAINTAELVEAVKEFPWPPDVADTPELENPYYFAFKAITDLTAQHQKDLGIHEPVDFIFDDESEKSRLDGMWDLLKFSSAPKFRKYMGDEPSFQKDENVLPLQAADLYAWWIRKWEQEGLIDWARDLPFPWGKQRDIRRFHAQFGKKDFLIEFERGLSPEARARWPIVDPKAALRELEKREAGIKMTLPDPSSPLYRLRS